MPWNTLEDLGPTDFFNADRADDIRENIEWLSKMHGCLVYKNSNTALTVGGTWYDITPNVEVWDSSEGFHSGGVITIPTGMGGYYRLQAVLNFSGVNGYPYARFLLNAITILGYPHSSVSASNAGLVVAADANLSAGDTVKLQAMSSGTGAVVVSGVAYSPYIALVQTARSLG